jgi:hypothetical protein
VGYRPEAIIFASSTESGGFALCIDAHGHGLYLPETTLHEALDIDTRAVMVTDDATGRRFFGDPLAAFISMLASRTA